MISYVISFYSVCVGGGGEEMWDDGEDKGKFNDPSVGLMY
jgi:hypothetical protein